MQSDVSADEPLDRLYRVWVDENVACMMRHCRATKPGTMRYMRCLSENCRRDVSAVEQQDADATSTGVDSEATEQFLLGVVQACYRHHCGGLQLVAAGDCLMSCAPSKHDLQQLTDDSQDSPAFQSNPGGSSLALKQSSDVMTRRRRVNDDVSQCIQSYCGNEPKPNRFMCIVDHCHRSRSIY